ncbi:hypothetical protein D4R99_05250 [bacterium]|nr:MAG: hypothetical protein D4R99_05250 [bacterium]
MNEKLNFNPGDPCIILRDGIPTASKIIKKVTVSECVGNDIVVSNNYYVEPNSMDVYRGDIWRDKADMLSTLSAHIPDVKAPDVKTEIKK